MQATQEIFKQDLKAAIKNLPSTFGIYQYFDSKQRLLYVGKAKNLKKRVSSYFDSSLNPNKKNSLRIQNMILKVCSLHVVVVNSEKEALILENQLIKSQNPKYNILLRDDKTYPYICIDLSKDFPRPEVSRKVIKNENMLYFGPYPKGCTDLLKSLYDIYPLIQQATCLKSKKACMYFQIQKCLAPCEGRVNKEQYAEIIKECIKNLKDKSALKIILKEKMLFYASKQNFELALFYKQNLKTLEWLDPFNIIDSKSMQDIDALYAYSNECSGVLLSLFVRSGKIISLNHVFFKTNLLDLESSYKQIYTQAILKLIKESSKAKEIILDNLSQQSFLELKNDLAPILESTKLIIPKTGYKAKLLQLASKNAEQILQNHLNKNEQILNALSALKDMLDFREIFSIEVFDTSHHLGENCVGSMIYYENHDFNKQHYRHYKLDAKDEYGQIKELLTRRAKSFSSLPPPDLWIIDGGKAQLKIAYEILHSCASSTEVLAISKEKRDAKAYRAKGGANDILHALDKSYKLLASDKRLQAVQMLRDEAHRFAISFHRKLKNKIKIP